MTTVKVGDLKVSDGVVSGYSSDSAAMERPSKHPHSLSSDSSPHSGEGDLKKQQVAKPNGEIGGSPVFWLACWFAVNIIVTIQNKSFFVFKPAFKFPVSLSGMASVYFNWCFRFTLQHFSLFWPAWPSCGWRGKNVSLDVAT
jgi:hypothetical protein